MKKMSKTALADVRFSALDSAITSLHRREDYVSEIARLWSTAQENFLTIGRYLNRAKDTLEWGEFEAMIERELPFSASVARKFRAVATLADSGAIPSGLLPRAYSVAYEVCTLTDEERAMAVAAGVVHPEARREEVAAFKRRLRTPAANAPTADADRRARLEAEIKGLEKRREVIDKRLNELAAALAELNTAAA